MGTQQLLLIVLGVIIVGIAIAVGITIFNNQAYNANQQAVSQELNTYGTMVVQWWKTPIAQGGAGQEMGTNDEDDVADAIGFINNLEKSDNGQFSVTAVVDTMVTLHGLGTEKRNNAYPLMRARVMLNTGNVEVTPGSGLVIP